MERLTGCELFVVDEAQRHACKLLRKSDGGLLVEFKMKSKDKKIPSFISMDAANLVDQIMAAMNAQERERAYCRWGRIQK